MLFDFAFKFPLLRNPFAVEPLPPLPEAPAPVNIGTPRKPSLRPRPIHRPGVAIPERENEGLRSVSHKRRRGWEPAEQTGLTAPPIMNRTVSKGFMDTQPSVPIEEIDETEPDHDQQADHPPAKRRRMGAFTDTILSGALNFALVGSAVGLTAFRFWKLRGMGPDEPGAQDQPPPPPYDDDWVKPSPVSTLSPPVDLKPSGPSEPATQLSRKRTRPVARQANGRRRPPNRPRANSRGISPAKPIAYNETDDDLMVDGGELDESMDWMSEQLRSLIAEGQKALGKEIVIGTDTGNDDDLVDDGADGWEDQDVDQPQSSQGMRTSQSSNFLRPGSPGRRPPSSPIKRRNGHARSQSQQAAPTFPYQSHAASASMTSFDRGNQSFHSVEVPPSIQAFDDLYHSTKSFSGLDDRSYAREGSPDLRTAMDRVRRAYGIGR